MSPNLNAYAERFVSSIKEQCLEKLIFVGQASLRRAIDEFTKHYRRAESPRACNRLIRPQAERAANDDPAHRRPRLGGMLNF
jgi:putative transposase